MKNIKIIKFFINDYDILDNFAAYTIEYNRYTYPTVEHAYQALKFEGTDIFHQIRVAKSPYCLSVKK